MSGRRSWVLGGALTALVVVVALVTYLLVRSDPYVAPAPSGTVAKPDPAGAAHALQQLEDAVGSRDAGRRPRRWPRPTTRAPVTCSRPWSSNAEALHVEDFTARYVDDVGAVDPAGGWQAAVDLTWRFDGFDQEPVHEEVLVAFQVDEPSDAATVGITSFGGGDRRSPLWLSGPVEVRRSDRHAGARHDLGRGGPGRRPCRRRGARSCATCCRSGTGSWWSRCRRSEEALDAALGAEPGSYADIAAVTASVDGTAHARRPRCTSSSTRTSTTTSSRSAARS